MSPAYKVLAVVLTAPALFAGGYRAGVSRENDRGTAAIQTVRAAHAQVLQDIAGKTLATSQIVRKQEAGWALAQEGNANVTERETKVVDADRDAAAGASGRLRQQLAAYRGAAARAGTNPGAAPPVAGQPGGDAIGVLAGVLERADQRAGVVELYADRLRVAGVACERDYDALTAAAP